MCPNSCHFQEECKYRVIMMSEKMSGKQISGNAQCTLLRTCLDLTGAAIPTSQETQTLALLLRWSSTSPTADSMEWPLAVPGNKRRPSRWQHYRGGRAQWLPSGSAKSIATVQLLCEMNCPSSKILHFKYGRSTRKLETLVRGRAHRTASTT